MSQIVLNNDSVEPLYRQLENLLKDDIETGRFPAGSKLPIESELVTMYRVSRVTHPPDGRGHQRPGSEKCGHRGKKPAGKS